MAVDISTISNQSVAAVSVNKPLNLPINKSVNNEAVMPLLNASAEESVTDPEPAFEPSFEELQSAVTNINEHVQNLQRGITFSIDDGTGRTIIKVIDTLTDEVVRQIPSEEVLEISANLQSVAGLIFKANA